MNKLVLLGTFVNGACILIGSILGMFLQHIPEKIKETVMSGIGLTVIVLGLQMGFKSDNFIMVIISIVGGAVLGEWMNLEARLNSLGNWIERRMKAKKELRYHRDS